MSLWWFTRTQGLKKQTPHRRQRKKRGVLSCKGKGEVFPSSRSGAGLSLRGMWLFEVASWEVFLKGSSLAGAGWHSPTSARDVTNTLNSSTPRTTYLALQPAHTHAAQCREAIHPHKLGSQTNTWSYGAASGKLQRQRWAGGCEDEGESRANHRWRKT